MNRVCLAFLTKDKVELSRRTIEPLLNRYLPVDIFWIDGSVTEEGKAFPVEVQLRVGERHRIFVHLGIRGGPDAAVAYALTMMLKGGDYTHVGLVENDVLLPDPWFEATMVLFNRGREDGLRVGAVSARCYDDRILVQRDGYAVMHNLGWGQVIFTREAAHIALANMRTLITTENRRLFCQLSGLDIGAWWAFRGQEHNLCADWGNDRILASYGLASLTLVPSQVEMIGQSPPFEEQGLKIASEPVEALRNDAAFALYAERMREGWTCGIIEPHLFDPATGTFTIFAHQVSLFGGEYQGDWRLHWEMGYGPFAWKAGEACPTLTIPLSGTVEFLFTGPGEVRVEDMRSGYSVSPRLPDNLVSIPVPASVSYREIRLTALSPGVLFRAVITREPQPFLLERKFDWHTLPPV